MDAKLGHYVDSHRQHSDLMYSQFILLLEAYWLSQHLRAIFTQSYSTYDTKFFIFRLYKLYAWRELIINIFT